MNEAPKASAPAPEVSVVIPTRDTRELTLACLRSLAAPGTPELDVVVVDDASTDGTREAVAAAFPLVRVVANRTPLGFSASVNRGIAQVQGRIVLLLNSDTEAEVDAFSALLAAFQDPALGVAGAQLYYPDGRKQWSGGSEPGPLWLFLQASGGVAVLAGLPLVRRLWRARRRRGPEGERRVDWVTGAALGIRREALEQVGTLDERFNFYAQDLDLCLRARDAGWAVRIVPGFRIRHWHGSSISRTERTIAGQHLEALWCDLLRWAEKRHGTTWARRARRAIVWGARFRVLARMIATPAMAVVRGAAWSRGTAACRRALKSLR